MSKGLHGWSMLFCVVVCQAGVGTAWGAPLLVASSQTRSISGFASAQDAFTGPFNDSDSEQAPDFAPFAAAAAANAFADSATGSGGGQQDSSILDDAILVTGSMFVSAEVWDLDAFAEGSSLNRLEVTFQITAEVNYLLRGELQAFDQAITELSLRDGANQEIFGQIIFGSATILPIDESGVLVPGHYTLEVRSEGNVSGFDFDPAYASGAFDISFDVTTAAEPGGEVPDGDDVVGPPPLRASRLSGGDVRLRWNSSCRTADDDFIVYEGEIGNPGSLVPVVCSTTGLLEWDVVPAFNGALYVVVPTDGATEGSYGDTSAGVERQPSALACLTQLLGAPVCP